MTLKEAIKIFEDVSGEKVGEAEEVRMIGMMPPIDQMNNALNALENCKYVSLLPLQLCCGQARTPGQCRRRPSPLVEPVLLRPALVADIHVASANHGSFLSSCTCRKLSLSTNMIEKIGGLSNLGKLEILSLGRNNIKQLANLEPVADRCVAARCHCAMRWCGIWLLRVAAMAHLGRCGDSSCAR